MIARQKKPTDDDSEIMQSKVDEEQLIVVAEWQPSANQQNVQVFTAGLKLHHNEQRGNLLSAWYPRLPQ
jgi:hypothetical protein